MKDALMMRFDSSDLGTYSELCSPGNFFSSAMGELPWRGNAHNESCIPCGVYVCELEEWLPTDGKSPYHAYRILDVPGRTGIWMHRANFFGDTTKGFKSHVKGCMGPGTRIGEQIATVVGRAPQMQKACMDSARALNLIIATFGERFRLRIESACEERFEISRGDAETRRVVA